jgi:hypothetical protein
VFTTTFEQLNNHANYDRHPRTGEFVVMTETQDNATTMVVVLNWFEELRRRMAAE